jgi:hypothetical protein
MKMIKNRITAIAIKRMRIVPRKVKENRNTILSFGALLEPFYIIIIRGFECQVVVIEKVLFHKKNI